MAGGANRQDLGEAVKISPEGLGFLVHSRILGYFASGERKELTLS